MELLDEAHNRAVDQFKERLSKGEQGEKSLVQLDQADIDKAAEILGISSIKYYDLKQNRSQDYIFSFDKMLDPQGDTGVYLIYMYVRICSILRKGTYDEEKIKHLIEHEHFKITNKFEKHLALTLLRLPEQIDLAL